MPRARVITVVAVLLLLLLWWAPWKREEALHKSEDVPPASLPQSSATNPPAETLLGIQERAPAESAGATVSSSEAAKQTELRGYVTWRVDGEPVAGVRVVAYASDLALPTPEAVMSLATGTELLASAESDSHGHFAIAGLSRSRKYDLIAGAPGIIASELIRAVVPGGSEVTVPVLHAYGALIQLVTEGKDRFEFPPEQRDSIQLEISFAEGSAEDVPEFPAAAALAGVPLDELVESAERILMLAGFEGAPTSTDPNSVKVRFPGYESKEQDFFFSRLDQSLAKSVMPLVKVCTGFGDVECVPIGLGAVLRDSLASRPLKMLLEAKDAAGRIDTFSLDFSSAKPVMIRGLPLGDVPVRAFAIDIPYPGRSLFSFPFAGDSAVGETPLRLEVDFTHAGFLHVACKTEAGADAPGGLEVVVSNVDAVKAGLTSNRVMSQVFRCQAAEMSIGPLNAGDYTVRLIGPRAPGDRASQNEPLTVRDDEITDVTFEYGVR
ncbi:MAG TPA: carboxypeptidase-like regulatory domain-containing protein [Planctomycetota bacterium]|nr:carboxypeptidase-like regulatory domain-containing protein [Planctomycetota bacterium]